MYETNKCYSLRKERGDFDKYLKGDGIDIGAGCSPLQVINGSVRAWDMSDGDAQYLENIKDESFDFVYSSHCFEHLHSLDISLHNWSRVLKPGGVFYCVVPDYTLYEKHHWPSLYNSDHKHSFSLNISRYKVKRGNHWHIYEDLVPLLRACGIHTVQTLTEDLAYDYNIGPEIDQTLGEATAQICIIGIKEAM